MRRKVLMCGLWLAFWALPGLVAASEGPVEARGAASPAAAPIRDVAPVVVTGRLPGPGMWKVSRGDHVMYVLGTVGLVPKSMQWVSRDVEDAIARSGEALLGYGVAVDTDVGFFGKLALIPSLVGARKNPDGARLNDLVPADTYAHWLQLKQRYIGRDDGVEKWRPVFAAVELYEKAFDRTGLAGGKSVQTVIERAVRKHGIKRTEAMVKVTIKAPKAAIKAFRAERVSDLECFDKTLEHLESDLARMVERANAWAVGDIETLRALPLGDQYRECARVLTQSAVGRQVGLGDVEAQVRAKWLAAAEAAIADNRVSFAAVPVSQLLQPDGFLYALEARGYVVEAPGTGDQTASISSRRPSPAMSSGSP